MSTRTWILHQTVKDFERLSKRKISDKELSWLFRKLSSLPMGNGVNQSTAKPVGAFVDEVLAQLKQQGEV